MQSPTEPGYYWMKHSTQQPYAELVLVVAEGQSLFVFQFGENIPMEIGSFTSHYEIEWLEKITYNNKNKPELKCCPILGNRIAKDNYNLQ